MSRAILISCFAFLTFARLWADPAKKTPPHPDNSLIDGPALMSSWTPPVYPADALKEKVGGRTVVRIIVDEHGVISSARILKATDPRLGEAALTAVKTWKFTPAMDNQKPVASCLDVPLFFNPTKGDKSWPASLMTSLGNQPSPASTTSAEPKTTPPGDYPTVLSERKLSGAVRFASPVDSTGHLVAPRILAASHADFVLPALTALKRWEFTPAKQGDLAVATEVVGEVTFEGIGGNRTDVLAANGITAADGGAPAANPQILQAVDPVWPHALLLQGAGGEAAIEFTVDTSGLVADAKVRSASQPEFGQAALAALEAWRFRAALSDGHTTAVSLVKRVEFIAVPTANSSAPHSTASPTDVRNPPTSGADSNEEWVNLVQAARAGTIEEAHGLDEKLTPILRVSPIYPAALLAAGRPKGAADIEFVIARDGRARLPRIVSASQDDFGWAAATAVAQWIFQPPHRGGQPVDVKVRIPFTFAPPDL